MTSPPPPPWTAHARQFAVTTNRSCLELAATSCEDQSIVTFLRHPDLQENRQIHPSAFTPLVDRLIAADRLDEACIVRILGLRFVALAMAELETYDSQHREFIETTCADLAKESTAFGYLECQALFVGLLATGAAKLRRYAESVALFYQAISLARQVVSSGARCYMTLLAGLLGNFGNALRFAGRNVDAMQALSEAVAMRRQCPGHDPERDQRHLASSLSDLAAGFAADDRFREAEKLLIEAAAIHRALASDKPKDRAAFAGTLSNLALVHTEQRRFHAARKVTEEALAIRRLLAAETPEAHLGDLAGTLSNLGMLLDDLRDSNGAVEALGEAIAIRRSLAQTQPSVFGPDLAASLNNLGNILQVTGSRTDIKAAFAAYSEALDIRRQLAADCPELYEPAVAQTLGNVAALRCATGHLSAAITGLQEVIPILEGLCRTGREAHAPALAGALGNLGGTLFRAGDYEEAQRVLSGSVELWRQLACGQPEVYEGHLAGTLNDLALSLSKLGHQHEALRAAKEAVVLAERLNGYLYLAKGDVSGAYWLVMTDSVQRGCADEVYAGLATVRDPMGRLASAAGVGRLAAARAALTRVEGTVGAPLRLVITEKLSEDHVLFGVLSSDTGVFQFEITEDFAPSARSMATLLYEPFADRTALGQGVDAGQVIRMGEILWSSLPAFVQDAVDPAGRHQVLLCGDPDSLDIPWEAIRFGRHDSDWLGLHRHLARIPSLAERTLSRLHPEVCGAGSRSAAILCPWNIPNQAPLQEALAEATEVAELLRAAGYSLLPDGNPVLGRSASVDAMQSVLMCSPTILHFAGHGDIVRHEVALVLWGSGKDEEGDALFDRRSVAEARETCSRPSLFTSRPLVVLNACWAGRSRDFGGQREDLASAFLDEGASCVIACPTPVHDDVGRMLATLLYVPSIQDQRGLAFTFERVRQLVARKCRDTSYWWTWFWMRYQGNPYARLSLGTCDSDRAPLREQRKPKALELVRDLIPQ